METKIRLISFTKTIRVRIKKIKKGGVDPRLMRGGVPPAPPHPAG